jgi:hypothetical protein
VRKWFRWPWLVLYAILVLAFAAWYVPKISADRYREPIHAALEKALGRKVKIGKVQFSLIPSPGFTIQDVDIGEDPAIGAEPIAYVSILRARPALSALFGGPLTFASVDLEVASLNLTRVESRGPDDDTTVHWNFTPLMQPRLLAAFPSIHLISGRVNFKFGDTKSIFYLLKTDVDLWPPSKADGPWTLRIKAEPARTDRTARGFGSFSARGQWYPSDRSVTLDVKLEKSELGDMATLFEGSETNLHGHIWGDAHLAGPINRVGVAGRLTLDDIHGWNQTPPGGDPWPLAVSGAIDIPGQTIDARVRTTGKQSPIDLRYRVSGYLGKPRWGVTALFSRLPISPVLDMARNLGVAIPPDTKLTGEAEGAVGLSVPNGVFRMDGALRVTNSSLTAAGAPPLRIATADLRFAGPTIALAPATVTNESNESAALEAIADVSNGLLEASLTSDGMSIESLRRQVSVTAAPLLSAATEGSWSGSLHYSNMAGVGVSPWSGAIRLKDAAIAFEAFSQPVRIRSADATIDGAGISIRGLNVGLGGIDAQGEYRYDSAAARPHRFRLNVRNATGAELERLLMPTLRRGNFFNYAFNFGRVPEPDWLRAMRADGTLQIGSLDLATSLLTKVKARVIWDGTAIRLSGVQAQSGEAAFTGSAGVDLSQRQPAYAVSGLLKGLPWRSGEVDAEGTLTTSGTGSDLLTNMSAKGSFRAREIDLEPVDTYDKIDGCFDWQWDLRNPKLKLTQLVMTSGGDTFLGAADMLDNGQLVLRVSDGTKQIQASGALLRGDSLKLLTQ